MAVAESTAQWTAGSSAFLHGALDPPSWLTRAIYTERYGGLPLFGDRRRRGARRGRELRHPRRTVI